MTKMTKPLRCGWLAGTLGIASALTLAIGMGFLLGRHLPPPSDALTAVCRHLPFNGPTADCIALRSAVATENAALFASWGLWIAFGSLVASSGALWGLVAAFQQGRRAIHVAAEANRIASENGKIQARAYVVVQTVECRLGETGMLVARVTFQNSGLSPARRLRWLYNARLDVVAADGMRRDLTLGPDPDLEKSHWRQDIPSAGSWTSFPLGVTHESDPRVAGFMNGAKFIALTVKIVADYRDVFGEKHLEVACFQGGMKAAPDNAPYTVLDRSHDDAFDRQASRAAA